MPGGKKVPGNQVPRFPHIMQAWCCFLTNFSENKSLQAQCVDPQDLENELGLFVL